jgi:DNA (cytosine-5)-methyltransferase 1
MLRVISLFSGCGGADLGVVGGFNYLGKRYARNKSSIVYAGDVNERAVATYNANFSHKAVVEDVASAGFGKGAADVVIGGFPCQAFSTVNPTKDPNSKSGQLFWEMAEVIGSVRPQAFIAENVKGFYRLAGGKYFQLAHEIFSSKGYKVKEKLLNASHFGVPQLRERILIVGIRDDIGAEFSFPAPTHGQGTGKPIVTLSKVIDSLTPPDPKYYFSKKAVEGAFNAKPNMKRALAQNLEKPCLTITSHLAKVSINSRDPVLLVNPRKKLYRRFTPREAARIQSFSDNFTFVGSDGDAYRQIGNAVPPVLMWHLFRALEECLSSSSLSNAA